MPSSSSQNEAVVAAAPHAAAVAGEAGSTPYCVAIPPTGCYHCASPNPPGRRFRAVVNGAEREFCCAGCLAVAKTIHAAGLESFYVARTASADRAPAESAPEEHDEWSHWDEAAAQAKYRCCSRASTAVRASG
jgi:hypothetical protein